MLTETIWLSFAINETVQAYGNRQGLISKPIRSIAQGDNCNESTWCFPNHLGTHVDTPKHFFEKGDSVDIYQPDFWFFNRVSLVSVRVNPGCTHVLIGPEDVIPFIKGNPDIVLIKTDMGKYRLTKIYWESNPGLTPSLAYELRSKFPSLRAIGIDFISISSYKNRSLGKEAHSAFLDPTAFGKPIVLIEDMNLSPLDENTKVLEIIAMPLRVENSDGAPCSVIARVMKDD